MNSINGEWVVKCPRCEFEYRPPKGNSGRSWRKVTALNTHGVLTRYKVGYYECLQCWYKWDGMAEVPYVPIPADIVPRKEHHAS